MPTNEELHAADQRHEAAIEELRAGLNEQRELISRHDQHINQLDDLMSELRETLATKEDIAGLREDLRSRESVHERLDYYRERLAEIEEDDKHAQGMKINRLVVWLFVGELVIAASQLWFMVLHG